MCPSSGLRSATQNPAPTTRPVRSRAAGRRSCRRRPSPPRAPPESPATSWRGAPGRNPTAPPVSLTAHHRSSTDSRVCSSNQSWALDPRRPQHRARAARPPAPSSVVPTGSSPAASAVRTERSLISRDFTTTGRAGSHSSAWAVQARAASFARPRPCTRGGEAVVEVEHLLAVLVAAPAQPADADPRAGVRLLDDPVVEPDARPAAEAVGRTRRPPRRRSRASPQGAWS